MDTVIVPAAVIPPPPPPGLIAHAGARLIGRQNLRELVTPPGTATHRPIPHAEVVEALIQTLGFRKLDVVSDGYAITPDGNKMFGVLQINVEESGVRFCIGVRNSHDKTFALALTVGYVVCVCDNLAFHGDFSPVMRRHTKNVEIADVVAMAIERCQRSFPAMTRQINAWQNHTLSDDAARLIIYRAFVERTDIDLPRHLAPLVHAAYFEPPHDEFKSRTMWSLSNGFTEALKVLDDIPRFRATAKLGPFLEQFS